LIGPLFGVVEMLGSHVHGGQGSLLGAPRLLPGRRWTGKGPGRARRTGCRLIASVGLLVGGHTVEPGLRQFRGGGPPVGELLTDGARPAAALVGQTLPDERATAATEQAFLAGTGGADQLSQHRVGIGSRVPLLGGHDAVPHFRGPSGPRDGPATPTAAFSSNLVVPG